MTDYNRVYNFSAGPSVLPLPVLESERRLAQLSGERSVCDGNEPPFG